LYCLLFLFLFFFFQAEDGIRDRNVTGVQTCALPISNSPVAVINRKLEDQLFRGRDPIGQSIRVAGVPFTVIGVYTPPPNLFSGSTPPFVGIPHGAFAKHVPYFKGWMRLAVAPAPIYSQQQAMDEVVATLRSVRG